MSVSVILSEFGPIRQNAGDARLPTQRLEPALSSIRRFLPNAIIQVYADEFVERSPDVQWHVVKSPFSASHHRYGWRSHDLFQVLGLLDAQTDVAIAMDADMAIVSPVFASLMPITRRFGVCMPINDRHFVKNEFHAVDGRPLLDDSRGFGTLTFSALISFATQHSDARRLLQRYASLLREDPGRAPPRLWLAAWETGVVPYILAPQWCVTARNAGIGEEIVLHLGHDAVKRHYHS